MIVFRNGHIINSGHFGTVKMQVRFSVMIGVSEPFELDADVIGIARSGEVEVAFGPGGPPGYMYGGARNTSWVRLDDGKCEHSKHWVVGEHLDRLIRIHHDNQPTATVTELPTRETPV